MLLEEILKSYLTALKMSVFGVFLVRIFSHLGWIRMNMGMNTEIYAVRMRENMDQKTPNTDTFYAFFRRYRKETFAWIGFNLEFIKNIFTCYCKPLCNEIAPFWNVCAIKFCTIFSWFSGLFNCIACKRLPGQILRNIFFAGTRYLTY